MLRLVKETLWKIAGGIVASALLLVANAMGYHPDRWLAEMILGTISDPQTLLALKWSSVAVAAIVGGAIGHVLLGVLERKTQGRPHSEDGTFTLMPVAVQRVYEALCERKGPSLDTVERRAREEFGGSIPAACATGMGRHLTIYGEPRPSTVREELSAQAHFELGGGDIRFAEDASKLLDANGREVWVNLAVKEAELSAHLKAIRTEMPSREDCDTWLLDATHYVIGRRWLAPGETVGSTSNKEKRHAAAVKALDEIREMAGKGRLCVEGSVAHGYLPAAITLAHWVDHRISLASFLAGHREQMQTERLPASDDRTSYSALKVNKRQVEELWPPIS